MALELKISKKFLERNLTNAIELMMQYSENKIKSLSNTYYENGWVVIKNFISKKN